MAYSIKRHEVDRVMNVLVALGWELIEEVYENGSILLKIRKTLSPELLKAAAAAGYNSSPQ